MARFSKLMWAFVALAGIWALGVLYVGASEIGLTGGGSEFRSQWSFCLFMALTPLIIVLIIGYLRGQKSQT
jgi:hypothetical protein